MAEDQLRTLVEGIRARLQAELDAQLGSVTESHERTLADFRESAAAEAERRCAAELEAARAEWSVRLESEVASARAEAERTTVAELTRARGEAEQAAEAAASRTRQEIEQAVADERRRAEEEIARLKADGEELRRQLEELARFKAEDEARRIRAEEEIAGVKAGAEELRERVDRELAQARAALQAERVSAASAIAEARTASATTSAVSATGTAELLDAIRAIDNSTTLSSALAAVTRAAASQAPRAAMFVVQGSELREWPVTGVAGLDAGPIRAEGREAGFLSEVLRRGEPLTIGQNGGTPPDFARLSAGRSAIAVPFTLGGQPVAVLYADEGNNGPSSGPWRDSVQIVGRHGSAYVAYLTSIKTAQAMRLLGSVPSGTAASGVEDDAQAARRYARLLVSEIKLYNEGAVRAGRERHDLMQRLKPEIDRARKLYEERVPASVNGRDTYFQQELVQTLADGNRSLLG